MSRLFAVAAVAAAVALAGCSNGPKVPSEAGVCYELAPQASGHVRFNVVARDIPDMEHCAAELEAVRIRFLRLGGSQQEITGAYQGNFLFMQTDGVFTSSSYDGVRYPFLVRTGDGRLAPPGSVSGP
jgi:hypothetical protein